MEESILKETEQDAGLELDTDILRQQGSITSSLEDLYGYPVFSETFEKQIINYKEQEGRQQQIYLQQVFTGEKADEVDSAFQAVFSADTSNIIKSDYTTEQATTQSPWTMIGFTLLGMVLVGWFWIMIEKRRKGKKKSEADYYNY